jgi:hypothetical protein
MWRVCFLLLILLSAAGAYDVVLEHGGSDGPAGGPEKDLAQALDLAQERIRELESLLSACLAASGSCSAATAAPNWSFPLYYRGSKRNGRFTRGFKSQAGQDEIIAKIFNNKRDGFFVDLGANDAVHFSNTLALEVELGWRGVCVEPLSRYWPDLLDRHCRLVMAVAGAANDVSVSFSDGDSMSGIIGEKFDNKEPRGAARKFHTVSVETLFKAANVPPVIDYLSIDIEGAELYAFEKFPFDQYRFLALTVERPKGLRKVLEANGYVYVKDLDIIHEGRYLPLDELYIHKSHPHFEAVMREHHISEHSEATKNAVLDEASMARLVPDMKYKWCRYVAIQLAHAVIKREFTGAGALSKGATAELLEEVCVRDVANYGVLLDRKGLPAGSFVDNNTLPGLPRAHGGWIRDSLLGLCQGLLASHTDFFVGAASKYCTTTDKGGQTELACNVEPHRLCMGVEGRRAPEEASSVPEAES